MRPGVALALGAAWAAVVLAVTLAPAPAATASAAATPWWCLACGATGTADIVQNLMLMAPIGFLLRVAGTRFGHVAALAVAFPLAVEFAQLLIPGRDGSLSDVLANSVSMLLGWFAVTWRARALALTPRAASNVAMVLVIGFVITMAAAAGLLRPALHRAAYTRVRITPEISGRPQFSGDVIRFALNGVAYREREVPSSLPRGDVFVEATVRWNGKTAGTATIARIDGTSGSAVVSIDQRDDAFAANVFSAASAWRLRSPALVVRAPQPLVIGDTVTLRLVWRGDSIALTATHGSVSTTTGGRLRPWHAWILLNPFTGLLQFGAVFALWTALWVGSWALVVGWLLTMRREKREGSREGRREKREERREGRARG